MIPLKFLPHGYAETRAPGIDEPAETPAGDPIGGERPRFKGAETIQVLVFRVTNYHA